MDSRRIRNPYLRKLLRDPLILPFYVPSVVLFVGFGLLTPILPLYAESFDVSYGWVGAVTSAQAFGMLLADLPSGMLLRRLGHKRAMLGGMAILIAMVFALYWAPSIYAAVFFRFLSGIGMALFGVARHAYITEYASATNRGRALSLFGGLMRVGRFVGPPIGGWVAAHMGLRVPFLVSAIVTIPSILIVVIFLQHGPKGARKGPSAPSRGLPKPAQAGSQRVPRLSVGSVRTAGARVWAIIRGQAGVLIPAGLGQIFVQMIRSGRDTILPLYATNALGLSVEQVGLMLGIASAVEMVMFLPAGWVMDGLGRKVAIIPSFGIQAIAMGLVPLTGGFGGLLACTTAIGFANGLSSGAMMTLGSDLAPPDARGEFLGVWRLIGDVGGTGGPAVVGLVADALALPAAAVAMAASSLSATLIYGLLLPETLVRDQPESRAEPVSTSAE